MFLGANELVFGSALKTNTVIAARAFMKLGIVLFFGDLKCNLGGFCLSVNRDNTTMVKPNRAIQQVYAAPADLIRGFVE